MVIDENYNSKMAKKAKMVEDRKIERVNLFFNSSAFFVYTSFSYEISVSLHPREDRLVDFPFLREVGKSGHHRAAKRITSVTREGRTSATESRYSSAVVKPGKLFAVQW